MAWRFKVSKYKNAAPKFPKKEELIQDIPVGNAGHSCGNHIKASCVYMAFNTDSSTGGSLGYLPLNATGRILGDLKYIHAHGDFVSDLDFSPFDDYMLATGSQDNSIKVWVLPPEDAMEHVSSAAVSLPAQARRVERVLWHPTAEGVLAAATDTCVKIFDVAVNAQLAEFSGHGDQMQGVSWRDNGAVMASTCRDKRMRILDVRANKAVQETAGHQNTKDTRVQWLGNTDFILSTGFSMSQEREIKLWDNRNLASALTTMPASGSTGALMCFFDPDTNMVFLAGKSDNSLRFVELSEKSPYLTEGMTDRTEQIKGAALVPKRAMDVMAGEVDRLLVLVKNSVVSVPYIVPRKSYRDFHSDLYPDTTGGEPALTTQQWLSGQDALVSKVTLGPNKNPVQRERRGALFGSSNSSRAGGGDGGKTEEGKGTREVTAPSPAVAAGTKPAPVSAKPSIAGAKPSISTPKPSQTSTTPSQASTTPSQASTTPSQASTTPSQPEVSPPAEPAKPTKVFKGVRQSKYRYVSGKTLHPTTHLTNLRNISKTMPHESDFFVSNADRCAVPLDGPGGLVAVLELSKPGRLGDTADELPTLQNGSKVADLNWDPFDNFRLLVACDNTRINVWKIPPGGVPVGEGPSLTEPEFYLLGHQEKIYFVRFHPLVKDVVMTASFDMTVRMWNLDTRSEVMQLQGHQDQVFSLAWSPCSKLCCTVCKDGKIRVYEPRKSTQPIKEGKGPGGTRGARVVWVLDGDYIMVSGFESSSVGQELSVYDSATLERRSAEDFQRSPSILTPVYDPTSSTIYLSCRGERAVHNYEISRDPPHLFGNTSMTLPSLHQGLAFLTPDRLDVRGVEVARALRLTNTSVEPVSFTVPRVRMEFFQDDLFPDIPVTWEAALTAKEWLSGQDTQPKVISLRPRGMKLLSEAPVEAPKASKYESFSVDTYKSDDQKKDELMSAITGKLELSTAPLPQDLTEGVEDEEWDD